MFKTLSTVMGFFLGVKHKPAFRCEDLSPQEPDLYVEEL